MVYTIIIHEWMNYEAMLMNTEKFKNILELCLHGRMQCDIICCGVSNGVNGGLHDRICNSPTNRLTHHQLTHKPINQNLHSVGFVGLGQSNKKQLRPDFGVGAEVCRMDGREE
mmetsp:Transcript_21839/g.31895  ORF Transcript_21839/g.31895 Transcript_21839/m.31895 type:complete len:113 (-) Transcript_21839:676-1014(-)